MTIADRWILPDGIEEILPPEAGRIEHLRRLLLDEFTLWGYDQVMPPMAEYLESLLTGVGHDLDLMTYKLTDQLSGRLMGLSADSTQQVARMDAHSLPKDGTARYCYCTPLLHTRPASLQASRSPIQVGAELYGVRAVASDIEIVSLMLNVLQKTGVKNITLDLGHVAIYRAIVNQIGLPEDIEQQLYQMIRSRSLPELDTLLVQLKKDYPDIDQIAMLSRMSGDRSILVQACEHFKADEVQQHLRRLTDIVDAVSKQFPDVRLHIDLAELRDYNYHTGLVFSAFASGYGLAVAKGGRYDATGRVFGRVRPATGFSADLKVLAGLTGVEPEENSVFAPAVDDAELRHSIRQLRLSGQRVIQAISEHDTPESLGCNQQLVQQEGVWAVQSL